MPTNTAAWINAKHARLEVGPAPYPRPGDDQIVVRNHAVAINPLEWIIQVEGTLTYNWLKYPTVLGSDVAGEVVEVGKAVTRFRAGDRVLGHAVGTDKDTNTGAEGGFQQYTVVLERLAAPIPETMSYEDAAVLPLGVSTAACALFQTDQLGLRHPSARATPTGATVLVWGGSTSVGSNAVQLATAAGYDVITTASPRNFDYVKSLGATQVFDYASPTVVPDIIAALRGRTFAGAVAIGTTGAAACVRIAGAAEGQKVVAIASPPVSFAGLAGGGRLAFAKVFAKLVGSNVALQVAARSRGVRTKYIFGSSLKTNEVSTAVYRDFLPAALAEGRYLAAPQPTVVGHGAGDFQHALDIQRKGVSAAKVVVTL
ncbi:zinc-binding alcohol dehydrogenase family protein [Winogradskya humida]|uniref:Alcohol dehydrogenase n=1 Tax=Winogradskya humida TaxID=113566 RepID=A0ABQ3ZUY6_9ACTN|nr:zinc-binding alcohol dehydrogenase family protein [Actinoplanes humidus]GIE22420.1 alcohol dehydrogenase [Actinoplanes humidus]